MTTTQTTIATTPMTPATPAIMVTETELAKALLARRHGSAFISFIARYNMDDKDKMNKGGRGGVPANPWFGNLYKISETHGGVNFDYSAGVERRLEAEGKDSSEHQKGPSWHRPVLHDDGSYTPLACHKDDPNRLYLRYRMDGSTSRYEDAKGNPVSVDQIKTWLPDKSGSYSNQGLDDPLKILTIGFANIVQLKVDGVVYIVKH